MFQKFFASLQAVSAYQFLEAAERDSPNSSEIIQRYLEENKQNPRAVNVRLAATRQSALHLAVSRADAHLVHVLIKAGININYQDNSQQTALDYAFRLKKLDLIRILLAEDGVRLNGGAQTYLVQAVGFKDLQIVVKLIEHPDTDLHGVYQSYSAFQLARLNVKIYPNNPTCKAIAYAIGKEVKKRGIELKHFFQAAEQGNSLLITWFLEDNNNKKFLNSLDDQDHTALMTAVSYKRPQVVKRLLSYSEIDPNVANSQGYTALAYAMEQDTAELTKLLVSYQNVCLDSPFVEKMLEQEHILVKIKAIVKTAIAKRRFTGNQFLLAAAWGILPEVKHYVELYHDDKSALNYVNQLGNTALHMATSQAELATIDFLLTIEQVEGCARNREGYTPLMVAVQLKYYAAVVAFLTSKKCVYLPEDVAKLLAIATTNGDTKIFLELLRYLAPTATVGSLPHCLLLAAKKGQVAMIHLLSAIVLRQYREMGSNFTRLVEFYNYQDTDNNSALHLAVSKGHGDVVKILLAADQVDINLQNAQGLTPIMIAVRDGKLTLVKLLLAQPGIDLTVVDDQGRDVAHYASSLPSNSITDQLLNRMPIQQQYSSSESFLRAAGSGDLTRIELYLSSNSNNVSAMNCSNERGNTAVIITAVNNQVAALELLLTSPSININAVNRLGDTALVCAARLGHREIVNILVAKPGINLSAKNTYQRTAAMEAQQYHPEIAEQLIQLTSLEEREVSELEQPAVIRQTIKLEPTGRPQQVLAAINFIGEIPQRLRCRFTEEIMDDPIILFESGYIFDRKALEKYFQSNGYQCPLTRKPVDSDLFKKTPTIIDIMEEIRNFVAEQVANYKQNCKVNEDQDRQDTACSTEQLRSMRISFYDRIDSAPSAAASPSVENRIDTANMQP